MADIDAMFEILGKNRHRLVRELDLNVGFIAALVARGAIDDETKAVISQDNLNPYAKNGSFIDRIRKVESFEILIELLWKHNKDLATLLSKWKEPSGPSSVDECKPSSIPTVNPSASGNTTSDREYFYIRTALQGSDKVLGTEDNECKLGAKVVLSKRTRGILWYQGDDDDHICSKDNDLVLDGVGHEFHLNSYNKGNRMGFWRIEDNYIVNKYDNNEVIELKEAKDAVGTEVIRGTPRVDDKRTQWHIDFISTQKTKEPILFDVGALPPLNVKVKPGTKAFFDDKIKETPYIVDPDKRRGRAYIMNIFKVKGTKDRIGTDVDRNNLKTLFNDLQFDVRAFDDSDGLSADEIKEKIKLMAEKEERINDAQCFVLCILSHGGTEKDEKCPENNKGFFYGTDGKRVFNDEVFTEFSDQKCQALKGKPRLIFFQACREYTLVHRDGDVKFDDFLVGYPTLEGKYAYRTVNGVGSYYMRQIVEVFMNNAWNTDVSAMMTMVKKAVIKETKRTDHYMIPETADGLTRKFYFFPQTDDF